MVEEKTAQALQKWYSSCREMYRSGQFRLGSVQLAFEVLALSVLGHDTWRPTHITANAAQSYLRGDYKDVQRAHGALEGRVDRHVRTKMILEGPEMPFEQWWKIAAENDKTVLVTRAEHGSKKIFKIEEVYTLPDWSEGMFDCPGKSIRLRKGTELKWLKEHFSS
jgi:hypothetical protein